jgi:hypothetical protein
MQGGKKGEVYFKNPSAFPSRQAFDHSARWVLGLTRQALMPQLGQRAGKCPVGTLLEHLWVARSVERWERDSGE